MGAVLQLLLPAAEARSTSRQHRSPPPPRGNGAAVVMASGILGMGVRIAEAQ